MIASAPALPTRVTSWCRSSRPVRPPPPKVTATTTAARTYQRGHRRRVPVTRNIRWVYRRPDRGTVRRGVPFGEQRLAAPDRGRDPYSLEAARKSAAARVLHIWYWLDPSKRFAVRPDPAERDSEPRPALWRFRLPSRASGCGSGFSLAGDRGCDRAQHNRFLLAR